MNVWRVAKKFNLIFSSHQKLRIIELMILMITGGLLETCSVSLILPFMNAVISPQDTMDKWYVRKICTAFGLHSASQFLIVSSVILAAVYLLKNAFLLFQMNIQYKFVYGNMFEMQKRLLNNFINRPYEYFLHINSGELIRIINSDTASVFELLSTMISLLTELIVSGMLIMAVFIISPAVTSIIAVVLMVLVIFISKVLKPMLRNEAVAQQAASAGMNKWLLQSIQGIKEVKVMMKEAYFQYNYHIKGRRFVDSIRRKYIFSITPRFIIEAFSMSTMFIAVALLIYQGNDLEMLVPVLTAAAMAAMRLLPSVNRISGSLASVSYGEPMLDKLIENLKDISGKDQVQLGMELSYDDSYYGEGHIDKLQDRIVFDNVTYRYPGTKEYILYKTSLSVLKGESAGIVGQSGAGKSTAVDIMLGLLRPQEGQILADGTDIRNDMKGWLSQTGYIPQMIFMLDDTIRANVAFGVPQSECSDKEIWRALKEASLDEFVKTLPEGLDTKIGERGVRISGGQRQRIGIARALYKNPEILIFDEATSALDNDTENAIMESVRKLQGRKTMIIIAHRLTTIESCDHVYRIEHGEIKMER